MSEMIGLIGLGNMGRAMASSLFKAGYTLTVYNRTTSKAQELTAKGAKLAHSPSEAVSPGGMVVTMVADDAALEEVVMSQGFPERLGAGSVHLSMSTVSPETARKLAQLHAQHGSAYLAAPVFGRPEAAAEQKLWICLSGPRAAKERVQAILKAMGQGIFDFGEDPGAANVVKLCGNFLILSAMEAMAEALTLAEKSGLDRLAVIDMLTRTMFSAPIYQNYGKMIAEKRHTPAGFRQSLGLKISTWPGRRRITPPYPCLSPACCMTAYLQALPKGAVIWIGRRSRSMCWKMPDYSFHARRRQLNELEAPCR
ncbi:MAG: NAD(P)-dependent oxidoreductase, partial [Chloroflexi bacterium]